MGFCGFLWVFKYCVFHKTQTEFFLGHRVYWFNRGSGSDFKTLEKWETKIVVVFLKRIEKTVEGLIGIDSSNHSPVLVVVLSV